MLKGLHARVIGGLSIMIKDILEYVDVVGVSCLGKRGLNILYKMT
jgi:hypothetical protein